MIKNILVFLMMVTTLFSASERISNIQDIYSIVKEVTYLNGEKREKVYKIEYVSPDYLRKEMILPNVNKGEIFQYEKDKTKVYIPLFDEITEENGSEDVSNFLSIIKDLKSKDLKDKEFVKNYYLKKIKELKYKDSYKIRFKKFEKINGFLLPVEMEIFQENNKLAELNLENIKVNSGLKRRDLKK
ncbi:hypothetical protein [uncultured Cetobacterium sp.]|uniref:hypothetical protein n=1 Tax=uncultured Cetobacterium sp. TaxID=527638 RepID=UPI00261BD651|nr:hypothetical protein [uncultured Cetobacterium sp.]